MEKKLLFQTIVLSLEDKGDISKRIEYCVAEVMEQLSGRRKFSSSIPVSANPRFSIFSFTAEIEKRPVSEDHPNRIIKYF